MRKVLWLLAIPGVIWGQADAASNATPAGAIRGGVHLESVGVYSGYFSSGAPRGLEANIPSPFLPGPSAIGGATATVGGSKQGEKSFYTWSYSPSYFNLFYSDKQGSNQGSLNHRWDGTWTRELGARWKLSTSVNGFIANLEQLYFNPSVLSRVAATPTTFDDLAAAMLSGKFTDAQFAALLTGAPVQSSPEQGYLYGQRMLDAAANIGLTWSPSGRTSISANFSGARMEHLNGGPETGQASSSTFVAPKTTTATASLSWSYSLSPRTQLTAGASSSRTVSQFLDGYRTNVTFSAGRTMSRRWFGRVRGGAGKLTYTTQVYAIPKTVQSLYGAELGFKTAAHTFLISYDRSIGDAYALGSSSTSYGLATWSWRRPGSSWSVSADGGYQELNNQTFQNTRSWRGGARVTAALRAHTLFTVQYLYIELPTNLRVAGLTTTENGITCFLTWSPSGYR